MKICPRCGALLNDDVLQCTNCGLELAPQQPQQPVQTQPPVQPPQPPVAPSFAPPTLYPQPPMGPKKIFQWVDVCTIFGFVSSVIGCFWASVLLLPMGLVFSIIGYRGDRTRALAVAGIVIAAVGLLVKIMMILYHADLLPYWFTDGIF